MTLKSYFLFEGSSSEPQVYPYWLKILLPDIEHHFVDSYETFKTNDSGFYFISGQGYPRVLKRIENSIKDIQDIGDVDYFFIVIDSDESSVSIREEEILSAVQRYSLPERTHLIPLIQERCFETMLLGIRKIIPRESSTPPLSDYISYYNVISDDPELMGNYDDTFNHAQFHAAYLKKATTAKRVRYSKNNCIGVLNESYLKSLMVRSKEERHISSFGRFIFAINEIREKLNLPKI